MFVRSSLHIQQSRSATASVLAMALWGLVSGANPAAANDEFLCDPSGELKCAVAATGMPLRVLVRPGATMHVEMDTASAPANTQPGPLSVHYVFEVHDVSYDANFASEGWFRIGQADVPDGFVQAKDAVPWKQGLVLAYTNPGPSDRKPVLMFTDEASLTSTVDSVLQDPATGEAIYAALGQGPAPAGVVSRERFPWVDVSDTFYLMPIIDHRSLEEKAPGLMAVQFAALTREPEAAQGQACDLTQSGGNECLQQQGAAPSGPLAADVVFVIDTTSSMQPYIDVVISSVREMSQLLQQKAGGGDALRFGIVAYRDSLAASPGLEYTVKNFTPELLPVAEFQALLDQKAVARAQTGSEDHPEDVFAGMEAGIGSAWSPSGARILILIGDASAHPVGSEKNSRALSEASIRQLADEQDVYIASIYITSPEAADDLPLARPQFEAMSSGAGEAQVSFSIVDAAAKSGTEGGAQGLESSLRTIMENLAKAFADGNIGALMTQGTTANDQTVEAVMGAVRAAVVDYLGSEASPPPSIIAWAVDHDLTALQKQSFEVRVLVKQGELQSLTAYIERILEQFRGGQSTSTSFLGNVVGAAATTSLNLKISDAEPLGSSPDAPTFLKGLPYKTEVLSLSLDEFRAASAEDRARFESRLDALVALYKDIDSRPESWVRLNEAAGNDDKVYLLSLRDLP